MITPLRPKPFDVCKRLLKGETIARVYLNTRMVQETLRGVTLDIGGGHGPTYFEYFKKAPDMNLTALDGSMSGIDFETDRLPVNDGGVETVLLCNVLEHIYNYQFLLSEVRRVCAADGQVVGFVPFWVGYHPDPHDYFRYTHESLARMFKEAGFGTVVIEALGGSPLLGNANTILLSFPRILRPAFFLWANILDALFLSVRPNSRERNPFGYFFKLTP